MTIKAFIKKHGGYAGASRATAGLISDKQFKRWHHGQTPQAGSLRILRDFGVA